MMIVPISLKMANAFVKAHHRHNGSVAGHKISIGLALNGDLIGVAIIGRPVNKTLDDGHTLEVRRVCVLEGHPGACSKLYARAKQIGQLLGYKKVITYTLLTEKQSSLLAVGATLERTFKGHTWQSKRNTKKDQKVYLERKNRWQL